MSTQLAIFTQCVQGGNISLHVLKCLNVDVIQNQWAQAKYRRFSKPNTNLKCLKHDWE